jgi:hypothetical protein
MLLRIDEIVAGTSKPVVKKQSAEPQQQDEGGE